MPALRACIVRPARVRWGLGPRPAPERRSVMKSVGLPARPVLWPRAPPALPRADPAPKAERDLEELGFNQEIYEEGLRPVRVWVATPGGKQPPAALALAGSASELHWAPREDSLALALAPSPRIDDYMMFRKVHTV